MDIRRHVDGAAAVGWQVVDDVRREVLEEPGALGLVRGPGLNVRYRVGEDDSGHQLTPFGERVLRSVSRRLRGRDGLFYQNASPPGGELASRVRALRSRCH